MFAASAESRNEIISDLSLAMFLAVFFLFFPSPEQRYISLAMLLAVLVCTGLESRNEIISDVSLAMFLAHFLVFFPISC